MKFAFDIDETITEAPEEFAAIINALMDAGHEVHIITFRTELHKEQTEKELRDYGILKYTQLHITGDKDKICMEHDIDMAIDDDCLYHYPNFWGFNLEFALPKRKK